MTAKTNSETPADTPMVYRFEPTDWTNEHIGSLSVKKKPRSGVTRADWREDDRKEISIRLHRGIPLSDDLFWSKIIVTGPWFVPMPHIFRWEGGDAYFVSDRARALLEALVPGQLHFTPREFKVAWTKRPAKEYFIAQVVGRDALIDWSVTPSVGHSGEAGVYIQAGDPVFKPEAVGDRIWRESRLTSGRDAAGIGRQFKPYSNDFTWISQSLWRKLAAEFPRDFGPEYRVTRGRRLRAWNLVDRIFSRFPRSELAFERLERTGVFSILLFPLILMNPRRFFDPVTKYPVRVEGNKHHFAVEKSGK